MNCEKETGVIDSGGCGAADHPVLAVVQRVRQPLKQSRQRLEHAPRHYPRNQRDPAA